MQRAKRGNKESDFMEKSSTGWTKGLKNFPFDVRSIPKITTSQDTAEEQLKTPRLGHHIVTNFAHPNASLIDPSPDSGPGPSL